MREPSRPLTLLDACSVVNLYATRWMEAILSAAGSSFAVVDVVAREAQFVFRGGDGEDAKEREPVDLGSFLDTGQIKILSTDLEAELLTFIDLTRDVGEGEAMTAALAIHRGCVVVTDDRKASRILTERSVIVHTSLDLIRDWGEHPEVERGALRQALIDLRRRGNYDPPRGHPLRGWWDEVTKAR